jgi:hypothetical protein
VRTPSGKFYFSSFLFTGHGASFRDVIPFTATQGPAAEVPAGGRAGVVDGTAPLPDPAFVRLVLTQVPARGIDKEKAARFLKTPFAEVLQLVGFALVDGDKGEPAAALPAAAAGAGRWDRFCRFHHITICEGTGKL